MSDQQQTGLLPASENGSGENNVDSNSGYGDNQQISPIILFNPGTILISGTGARNYSSTAADIYLNQCRPVYSEGFSSVLHNAPNASDNSVTFDKYIDSSIETAPDIVDKHVLPIDNPPHQHNEVNHSTLSLDSDALEMAYINDLILSDNDYNFAFDLQVKEMEHAQTRSDDNTAIAVAAPRPPPPPSFSAPDTTGTNVHENDIWICKETYEAERQRDIALWLRTLFPPNASDACSGDLLAVELEKLSVMKKLTLLMAMGNLYLVKKKESIMATISELHGANISIASLFNHGKRIVVQVDGRFDVFDKLRSFLFPDKLLSDRVSTHNVTFCRIQHHIQEEEVSKWYAKPCRGINFAYGGLGETHRKDACTNAVKSRTDVGEVFQIIANGERKCMKSGTIVSNVQHGHLVLKIADENRHGRFHGFLFGIENSRPLDCTIEDALKILKGQLWTGMFDAGHGPAATKGSASVSGGWKRDLFMNMIGHQPDNIGGIRLHLDRHQIDSFYRAYTTMAENRDKYEELLNRPIGGFDC